MGNGNHRAVLASMLTHALSSRGRQNHIPAFKGAKQSNPNRKIQYSPTERKLKTPVAAAANNSRKRLFNLPIDIRTKQDSGANTVTEIGPSSPRRTPPKHRSFFCFKNAEAGEPQPTYPKARSYTERAGINTYSNYQSSTCQAKVFDEKFLEERLRQKEDPLGRCIGA